MIKKKFSGSHFIVILSRDFPWSPTVLTSQFKIKVFLPENSCFLSLASEYYQRFEVDIMVASSLQCMLESLKGAHAVIDEGWNFSLGDLRRLSRLARIKPVLRIGGSYRLSANDQSGGSEKWTLEHWKVGGVTDAESSIVRWYSKTPGARRWMANASSPARDLRSVLKAGEPGKPACKPRSVPRHSLERVMFLRPTEVFSAGLYPSKVSGKLPLVRTTYNGDTWVSRELTPSEILLLKDIPEPIALLISRKEEYQMMTRKLYDSCKVPLKSLDAMLMPILRNELEQAFPEEDKMLEDKRVGLEDKGLLRVQPVFEWTREIRTREELDEEEADCRTPSELVDLLKQRVIEAQSEGRSKRSDYEMPSETIWDVRALPHCRIRENERSTIQLNWRKAFLCLRTCMLRRWKRNMRREIREYREVIGELESATRDAEALKDCEMRVEEATLWGWDGGSRPFFWRWPKELQTSIRDGFRLWIKPMDISWNEPQPKPNERNRLLMQKKIEDIRKKKYLVPGTVASLIRFFGVPKGEDDIRMVYDGTKSGLNDALWAPWFPLPTASTHLKMVESRSWMADNDAGEFFLNWMMDSRVRELCGVDLTHFVSSEGRSVSSPSRRVEIWCRCAMGLRPSPYVCVKGMLLAKEIIMGSRDDEDNVFRWDHVLLNLPGMKEYSPSKPWVSKRRNDGTIAADLVSFVDDLRPVASSEKECWEASQLVSKRMAWLGLQDAARKRNSPSQSPGPWAGIVITTDNENVYVSVSQKKWDKTKDYVERIYSSLGERRIGYKALESMTGYLVYVAQAYPAMKPYLAGLYGTLNSWRPDRTPDGFKARKPSKRQKRNDQVKVSETVKAERDFEYEGDWWMHGTENEENDFDAEAGCDGKSPPDTVRFVSRMDQDLEGLRLLTSGPSPPLRVVRGNESVTLIYGFGDASGAGFGAAIQLPGGEIFWRAGDWSWTITKEASSNYRELRNLVESVEEAARLDHLTGRQLLLCTDNSTAEAAFHRGGSTSPILHELVLRLRRLEMTFASELIIVHVSGKRMIECGVDAISRGSKNTGIMAGASIHSFIPLHESALDRSKTLLDWILDWGGSDVESFTPSHWPIVHRDGGSYLWSPPPAAADAALEWLGESIHKRSSSIHIVVVPRLMTSRWRKTLGKICDLELTIPCGTPVWPAEMYEPVVIGISLPLLRICFGSGSWRYKGSERVGRIESLVSRMWEDNFRCVGDSLRKLLSDARKSRAL